MAIIAYIVIILVPMPGLAHSGHAAIALLAFAIIMWASEAQVLAVTSLMLMFLQPILGIQSFTAAAIGFANPIIFLMIGGFILAVAIGKSGLAKRFTYWMLQKVGTSPSMSIFAAVFSTGILSAWIENVVAFAMLLPIIKTIVPLFGVNDAERGNSNFAKAMVLGASYGSLAGGFGTEIGTAPNLMAAAYTQLPFVNWMIFGFPLAIILLFVTWKLLGWIFPPEVEGVVGGKETLEKAVSIMGSITRTEKVTAAILFFTIGLWITTGITKLDSYSVALIGASLYFVSGVIDWKDAQEGVDWGLIIFFGGALSLGAALLNTGAASYIITHLIGDLGPNVSTVSIMLLLMVIGVIFTQVMSNIALSAILIPLAVTLAAAQGQPIGIYAVPVAFACSLSFMFPMADPTVAMAYGTGYVNIKEILKAGIPMVVIGVILTIVVMLTIAKPYL